MSVPLVRRSTFWTINSVAGQTVWNSLPGHLRDPAVVDSEQYMAGPEDVSAGLTFEALSTFIFCVDDDDAVFTSMRRILSTTTEGIRLRRRVDVYRHRRVH